MAQPPLKLLVFARNPAPHVRQTCREVEELLRARPGIEVTAVADDDDPTPEQMRADLAVVLGGDGAILRACRQFGDHQIPLLGVNLGRLGFLADLSPDQFRARLDALERREYRVVHHLMYVCEHHTADGQVARELGLNEVAIHSSAMSMIDVELLIDGEPVTTYSGDGLLISTPVGSTAHNLSAGGPILRQDLEAFVITPICPHTLTNRPLVDRADCRYEVRVPDAQEGAMLVVDGQIKRPLASTDRVVIRRADVTFQLARVGDHSYYGTLHRKLGWGGQPRLPNRSW